MGHDTLTYHRYIRNEKGTVRIGRMCLYKHDHIWCQQKKGFDIALAPFLKTNKFTHILEIGTASGGFTFFMHDVLPNTEIHTFDIKKNPELDALNIFDQTTVSFFKENMFDSDYNIVSEKVKYFISQADRLLIVVDGGNKVKEANAIIPLMRSGDYIILHDYEGTGNDEEWNKFEVSKKDMQQLVASHDIQTTYPELEDYMWACAVKV